MAETAGGVDEVLGGLLRYEEIVGVVAVSVEGLVIGRAGVDAEDADLAGALGASLVGVAERTIRRLGAGAAREVSVATTDGMVHLLHCGEFALIVFSERCNALAIGDVCEGALDEIGRLLNPNGVHGR